MTAKVGVSRSKAEFPAQASDLRRIRVSTAVAALGPILCGICDTGLDPNADPPAAEDLRSRHPKPAQRHDAAATYTAA